MNAGGRPTVLILGAGINGCSLARELVLNGVGAWVVDAHDVACGATSRSSRLIHGGLRYLEYGDLHLVRESLAERATLRKLAPQFVEPLRLYIPIARRSGGLLQSAGRFLGLARSKALTWLTRPLMRPSERGLWTVEMGLWLYDRFAADPSTPRHSVHSLAEAGVPRVDRARYRWLCGYSDAQMRFPERYCVALLEDTRQIAHDTNVEFRLFTYSQAEFTDGSPRVRTGAGQVLSCAPPLVINATGAWGDLTLGRLHVPAPRLFGGTKGSHFITHQRALKEAIGSAGVYAEAADGRLIFVLPFGDAVLVGTTDERFDEPPDRAVASDADVTYLVSTVNQLFPEVRLSRGDVTLTYSGVRPLPYAAAGSEGSISRDHSVEVSAWQGIPVLTLVGGKLTTSRAFGEMVADEVLHRLSIVRSATTVARYVPGGKCVPPNRADLEKRWEELAAQFGLTVAQIRAMWALCGNRVAEILESERTADPELARGQNVSGSLLPRSFVRWVIQHEWVERIEDLVERRLMLIYEPGLSRQTIGELAELLIEAERLDPASREAAVNAAASRCEALYGRRLPA
ncbi:MAG TPA: glycerol-3-phosphate dehydrogenase/oxidase [Planctomycetaceae bacterium]|jgi:glycerol-3-phosphate dehydrogenase|nr:glycerol-3-phosphate dehydrogenase/oxidase [Planctomycetaceae bacterium]